MLRTLLGAIILVVGTVIGVTAVPTAAADCYIAASGDCVQSPDSSASNVTAICRDGTDSHSETHSGTCSRHGGVAQWCPCGGASSAADNLPGLIASGGDDEFVALAIWPVTGIGGYGTAGTKDRAIQIALAECQAATGGVCQVAAGMHNGCAAYAIDPSAPAWHGGSGTDPTSVGADALSYLGGSGHVGAVHCSS